MRTRVDGDAGPGLDPPGSSRTSCPPLSTAPGRCWPRPWPRSAPTAGDRGRRRALDPAGARHRGRGPSPASAAATTALWLRLDASQLSDLVADQVTPMGWFSSGALDLQGRLERLLDWWLVLRGALDGVAPLVAGPMAFEDGGGRAPGPHAALRLGRRRRGDGPVPRPGRVPARGRGVQRGRDGGGLRRHGPGRPDLHPRRRALVVGPDRRRYRPAGADAGLRRHVRHSRGRSSPTGAWPVWARSPATATSGDRWTPTPSRRS